MEKKIVKKSGLRTASKVLSFLNLAVSVLLVLGSIAMFVFAFVTLAKVKGRTDMTAIRWRNISNALIIWGSVAAGVGVVSLGLSIPTVIILVKSMSFPVLLTFGILHVLTGVGLILGALMIATACVDCGPWLKNKKQKE